MIIKSVEQLKRYLADGGDPDRISIQLDPVPVKPTQGNGNGGELEGNHYYITEKARYYIRRYYG